MYVRGGDYFFFDAVEESHKGAPLLRLATTCTLAHGWFCDVYGLKGSARGRCVSYDHANASLAAPRAGGFYADMPLYVAKFSDNYGRVVPASRRGFNNHQENSSMR